MKPDAHEPPLAATDPAPRADRIVFGVLALLAIVPRWSGLSEWWLNPDEGIYYSILTRADFSGFWAEVAANAHPPLYYLLLRGLGGLTWDFLWFRAFSVLCGIGAVLLTAAVAREVAGRGTAGTIAAAVSGLVLALAPTAIELSQVIRPYTFQLVLLSGALLALLHYRRAPSTRPLVAYAVLTSAALLTHYSSGLAVATLGITVVALGARGEWRETTWQKLFASHAVPGTVVALMWFVHIRPLAGSALADDALDGWLSFYMIDGPEQAWLALLGFHHILAGPWLRGPLALLTIATLLWAARRAPLVAILGGTGLAIAMMAASLGVYPLGSTRHSIWLTFVFVPALGWLAASVWTAFSDHRRWASLGAVGLLLAAGGPVGSAIGAERAPWAPPDQVLLQEDLTRMIAVLDPTEGPPLLIMSAQTFYLLLPFFPGERESAEFSEDGRHFHFAYGNRRILTTEAWDFTAGPQPNAPDHVANVLREAATSFPHLGITTQDPATLLVGGWRPAFIDELTALATEHGFVHSSVFVPGLFAYVVSVDGLVESFGAP
ncbi:MAG: glycosyltransferase family 39 protein [Gemmatimonadota bacterium]